MIDLQVCIGSACHLRGSCNVIQVFQQMIEEQSLHDRIDFRSSFCMKQCVKRGVTVSVNGRTENIMPENARAFFQMSVLPLIQT